MRKSDILLFSIIFIILLIAVPALIGEHSSSGQNASYGSNTPSWVGRFVNDDDNVKAVLDVSPNYITYSAYWGDGPGSEVLRCRGNVPSGVPTDDNWQADIQMMCTGDFITDGYKDTHIETGARIWSFDGLTMVREEPSY
jgi:hypothetical protein